MAWKIEDDYAVTQLQAMADQMPVYATVVQIAVQQKDRSWIFTLWLDGLG